MYSFSVIPTVIFEKNDLTWTASGNVVAEFIMELGEKKNSKKEGEKGKKN
jgi:hypothetical protein